MENSLDLSKFINAIKKLETNFTTTNYIYAD